jgi:hypothetical protein
MLEYCSHTSLTVCGGGGWHTFGERVGGKGCVYSKDWFKPILPLIPTWLLCKVANIQVYDAATLNCTWFNLWIVGAHRKLSNTHGCTSYAARVTAAELMHKPPAVNQPLYIPLAYPGGWYGAFKPPRNYSKVLTKSSRIPSSVENTS